MNARKGIKTTKMWIDGKCFNIKLLKNIKQAQDISEIDVSSHDDILKIDDKIPYISKFSLPPYYYVKLKRSLDSDIERLASDTKTSISIPSDNEEDVKITGKLESDVKKAKCGILSLVANLREQSTALQFVGIPLMSEEIKRNFDTLKERVLGENIPRVEDSIFQKREKLHLTVNVLSLRSDPEHEEAKKVLEECKREILTFKSPLKIKVSGLNCMDDNIKKANILYAGAEIVDQTDGKNLQSIVNSISNLFYERGLISRYQDNVKLHMTVVNTKYRTNTSPKKRWPKREPIDATEILNKYKDYYFGVCDFDTVHLSLISSVDGTGYYKSLSTIKF